MGLTPQLEKFHRFHGLRATGMGRELELEWPSHPVYPQHGYVVRRRDLDQMVADNAVAAGATVLEGHEARRPDRRTGLRPRRHGAAPPTAARSTCRPATSSSPTAPTAGSDGRSARRGTATGRTARRSARTSRQPRHDDPWIESALDVKDRNGNPMPGYGWIFPVGDGTVNIGVGLLSTFRDFKSVNTSHLLDAYAHQIAERWQIDPDAPTQRATSGRIPMGGSVGPKQGPTYLVDRRRGGQRQPVQRGGHRLCLRDGEDGGRGAAPGARRPRPDGAAALSEAARRRVRAVLQGRPPVRPGDRATGADARAAPAPGCTAAR